MMTSLQKTGKTAVIGGFIGAVVGGPECSGDTLHFTADNTAGQALLHFDTEQAAEDHERVFKTALARANRAAPDWLHSYGVKGLGIAALHRLLEQLPRVLRKRYGGICAIILDGAADFVSDVNNPEECNAFVTTLEAIATEYDCAVVCVLHLNPAPAGATTKSRGHLGSQLERKCETDLRLVKDRDGVTTMFTACARRAPILEADGPRFRWSDEHGMHVSLQQTKGAARESAETEHLRDLLADAFGDKSSMRYGDLLTAIKAATGLSEKTAERKFTAMKRAKLVTKFPPNLWVKAH